MVLSELMPSLWTVVAAGIAVGLGVYVGTGKKEAGILIGVGFVLPLIPP